MNCLNAMIGMAMQMLQYDVFIKCTGVENQYIFFVHIYYVTNTKARNLLTYSTRENTFSGPTSHDGQSKMT